MTELEVKEICPKCGNVDFAFSRDMTSPRVCKCGHTWDALEKFRFSKLRQEIEYGLDLFSGIGGIALEPGVGCE